MHFYWHTLYNGKKYNLAGTGTTGWTYSTNMARLNESVDRKSSQAGHRLSPHSCQIIMTGLFIQTPISYLCL